MERNNRCPFFRFNPRARRGRDLRITRYYSNSTRFNPRARRGRDRKIQEWEWYTDGFNPRARRGRDDEFNGFSFFSIVSIHAPAGGATISGFISRNAERSFNPRARRGRDKILVGLRRYMFQFQSTRPQGARLQTYNCKLTASLFQSTRPQGARHYIHNCSFQITGFNPRARRGRDMGR